MIAPPASSPTRYVKTRDAADILGLSDRTLEKHRCYGTGPIYKKLGGRIVYAIEDLHAWATLGTRRSTSDCVTSYIQPLKKPSVSDPLQQTRG